jgi:hypothetical protein
MWHFTNLDCKLRFADGRKVVAGETLTVDCDPVLCKCGLHASERIIDALVNAPGLYVWSVDLGGKRIDGDDKSAAQSRTALWGYDAIDVILAWLRRVALDKIELNWATSKFGEMPDVVMIFLRTGDKNIVAEADAAIIVAANAAEDATMAANVAAKAAEVAIYAAYAAKGGDVAEAVWAAKVAIYAAEADAKYNQWLEDAILAGRPIV